MDVNGHPVGVGDWLRTAGGWEGQVVTAAADSVTLRMNSGEMRDAAAGELSWNWWDERSVGQS